MKPKGGGTKHLTVNRLEVAGRAVLCAPPPANGRVLVCHDGAHGVTRPTVGLRNRRLFVVPMCIRFWRSRLSMNRRAPARLVGSGCRRAEQVLGAPMTVHAPKVHPMLDAFLLVQGLKA